MRTPQLPDMLWFSDATPSQGGKFIYAWAPWLVSSSVTHLCYSSAYIWPTIIGPCLVCYIYHWSSLAIVTQPLLTTNENLLLIICVQVYKRLMGLYVLMGVASLLCIGIQLDCMHHSLGSFRWRNARRACSLDSWDSWFYFPGTLPYNDWCIWLLLILSSLGNFSSFVPYWRHMILYLARLIFPFC